VRIIVRSDGRVSLIDATKREQPVAPVRTRQRRSPAAGRNPQTPVVIEGTSRRGTRRSSGHERVAEQGHRAGRTARGSQPALMTAPAITDRRRLHWHAPEKGTAPAFALSLFAHALLFFAIASWCAGRRSRRAPSAQSCGRAFPRRRRRPRRRRFRSRSSSHAAACTAEGRAHAAGSTPRSNPAGAEPGAQGRHRRGSRRKSRSREEGRAAEGTAEEDRAAEARSEERSKR